MTILVRYLAVLLMTLKLQVQLSFIWLILLFHLESSAAQVKRAPVHVCQLAVKDFR